MKILLAEDDLTSRLFMNKYLSRFGECDIAANGIEAIEKFEISINEDTPYDLICLDIMMPKVSGISALTEIRKIEKSKLKSEQNPSKIIMTTALNDKETVMASYDAGCDAYAWKPIDLKQFYKLLEELDLI